MTMNELKAAVEAYREKLKEAGKKTVWSSEHGPVSMTMIDALVAAAEALVRRIDALEKRPTGLA